MTKEAKKPIFVQVAFDEWHRDPEYMREYAALADEFVLAAHFIKVRSVAGLTQRELADRMKTSQVCIVRLKEGKQRPSMRTLNRFSEATGHRVVINFWAACGGIVPMMSC